MKKHHVGLLMGGPSPEYEVSLKSGAMVLHHIDTQQYEITPVIIHQNGLWSVYDAQGSSHIASTDYDAWLALTPGVPFYTALEQLKARKISVFFNVMHGPYGEDGTIQGILDAFGVPYTGSGLLASALAMDKIAYKHVLRGANINQPDALFFTHLPNQLDDLSDMAGEQLGFPCVIKTPMSGSSIGVELCADSAALIEACKTLFPVEQRLIVERYIRGREFTCAVLGNAHSATLRALYPIEIIPQNSFFDFDAKYTPGKTQEITRPDIAPALALGMQELAQNIHNLLGCRGMSRTDMMVDRSGVVYILETNTLPGMTAQSLLPAAAREAGFSLADLIDTIIQAACES